MGKTTIKLAAYLEKLKVESRNGNVTCPCRLCKKFQSNLGFINLKYGFKKCEFALSYYKFYLKKS